MTSFTKVILSLFASCSLLSASEKPNVLFILIDDLGYGDLGYTGSTQIKTPNLDKLAKEGVTFTRAYASACFCGPSRAGVLTGRYQQRFGFEFNPDTCPQTKPDWLGLVKPEKTFGHHMKEAGYATAAIGKWHLGHHDVFHPNNKGFDYFFGMRGGGHSYFPSVTEERPGWYPNFSIERQGKLLKKVEVPYLTDWFTQDACNYMKRQKQEKKPWALYLAYNCPHGPLEAKQEDLDKYKHISPKGRRTYCAMVDSLDQNVGRLIQTLKKTGQYKNTLIVFLNDNGGSVETIFANNAPYWGTKATFYEGGIRVPMFIHYPAKLKASEYHQSVSALDILPTCLAFAHHQPQLEPLQRGKKALPRTFDGVNLTPFITGENQAQPHQKLYWRILDRGSAMVDGDWKMILTPFDPPALFKLSDDPTERNNLAAKYPEKLAQMINDHFDWTASHERFPLWQPSTGYLKSSRQLHHKKFNPTQP